MKGLKEHNSVVLALAIIGVCALLYIFFRGYQRYSAEQQQQTIMGPPTGAVGQALKATPQPPPQ